MEPWSTDPRSLRHANSQKKIWTQDFPSGQNILKPQRPVGKLFKGSIFFLTLRNQRSTDSRNSSCLGVEPGIHHSPWPTLHCRQFSFELNRDFNYCCQSLRRIIPTLVESESHFADSLNSIGLTRSPDGGNHLGRLCRCPRSQIDVKILSAMAGCNPRNGMNAGFRRQDGEDTNTTMQTFAPQLCRHATRNSCQSPKIP